MQGPDDYTFDVCVSDGTLSDCEPITVTVNDPNEAPVLTAIGSKNVDELVQLSFTATATDADLPPQTLTYSLSGQPSGASITTGGAFTWTPTEAQGPGPYSFDVCVSDSIDDDCELITVTVNEVNVAPVLDAIGDKNADELVELAFTATAADADIPVQTLTFSLSGEPAGAGITAGGDFTWTPAEAQSPGSYPFDVCVSDGIFSDCETITVAVGEENAAPVLDPIGNKNVDELVQLSFTATAADEDLPPQTLTFGLVDGPAGASITNGGAFTWTPTEAQGPGSYPFDVCVNDGSLDDCETITVTVNEVNVAPILATIGNKNVNELVQLSFTANAADTDIPVQPLTFSLSGEPIGASITAGGDFTWTPTEDQGPDSYPFDVCVSDGVAVDCETITVTVSDVDQAPVLSPIGDQTIDELAELAFTAEAADADLPAQTLTFSLSGEPAGAAIDPDTGAFSWTPTEAQGPGTYPFDVCVSDGGLDDCETITVTVNEINIAPVLDAVGNKDVDELEELAFTATAADEDLPAQTLTFGLVDAPAGAVISSGGDFTWTPTEAQGPGSYPFDVCVSDGELSDCETITVAVAEVNSPPALDAIGNQQAKELYELNFTATAVDPDLPANTPFL